MAQQILRSCFTEFTQKHYEKIRRRLKIKDPSLLQKALHTIEKLNPQPGEEYKVESENKTLYPDFVVTRLSNRLIVSLLRYPMPKLQIKKDYVSMLSDPVNKVDAETTTFIKKKLESAQWFIDALQQRKKTLLHTMQAIVRLQYNFFMEEDVRQLKPITLRSIAREINMDVSTVSRIVSNKSVQTNAHVYPLKFFFTEGISSTTGEEISNRAIKKSITEIIKNEDKNQPYSDEKIASLLLAQGSVVARRTVAKYREQLRLPVARLRKKWRE